MWIATSITDVALYFHCFFLSFVAFVCLFSSTLCCSFIAHDCCCQQPLNSVCFHIDRDGTPFPSTKTRSTSVNHYANARDLGVAKSVRIWENKRVQSGVLSDDLFVYVNSVKQFSPCGCNIFIRRIWCQKICTPQQQQQAAGGDGDGTLSIMIHDPEHFLPPISINIHSNVRYSYWFWINCLLSLDAVWVCVCLMCVFICEINNIYIDEDAMRSDDDSRGRHLFGLEHHTRHHNSGGSFGWPRERGIHFVIGAQMKWISGKMQTNTKRTRRPIVSRRWDLVCNL